MITLIIGGSGSGKSEYAEQLAVANAHTAPKKENLIYIATMQPFGTETLKKIMRHHKLRENKGFQTIEQYTDLEQAVGLWPEKSTVLLECMSNLLANERYRPDQINEGFASSHELVEKIVQGVLEIEASCSHLFIVTNDVFASGEIYEEETMEYISQLGEINVILAKKASKVVEVVCGIPTIIKDSEEKI